MRSSSCTCKVNRAGKPIHELVFLAERIDPGVPAGIGSSFPHGSLFR